MINHDISDSTKHVNVFPYSIFYVFYEQYLTMVEDTATSLAISLGSVFAVTFILGGFDIKNAVVTTFTIILILVSTFFINSYIARFLFYFISGEFNFEIQYICCFHLRSI